MVAAGAIVKSLSSCERCSILLQNCAMKVKSNFDDVDQQIAKVKLATVKSKTRQSKFATIGCSLQPVDTRWCN